MDVIFVAINPAELLIPAAKASRLRSNLLHVADVALQQAESFKAQGDLLLEAEYKGYANAAVYAASLVETTYKEELAACKESEVRND